MSLFDSLKKQVTDALSGSAGGEQAAVAAEHPGLFAGVIEMVKAQGVAVLVERFQKAGLSEVVGSWVGKGNNLPVSAEQVHAALGPDAIEALARKAGLPPGEASALLAKVLPGLVDRLTPGGTVEEPLPTTDTAAETPPPAGRTEPAEGQPEAREG